MKFIVKNFLTTSLSTSLVTYLSAATVLILSTPFSTLIFKLAKSAFDASIDVLISVGRFRSAFVAQLDRFIKLSHSH